MRQLMTVRSMSDLELQLRQHFALPEGSEIQLLLDSPSGGAGAPITRFEELRDGDSLVVRLASEGVGIKQIMPEEVRPRGPPAAAVPPPAIFW